MCAFCGLTIRKILNNIEFPNIYGCSLIEKTMRVKTESCKVYCEKKRKIDDAD